MAYGFEVKGPDGQTVVWSSALRACNIALWTTFNVTAAGSPGYLDIPLEGVQDSTRFLVTMFNTSTYKNVVTERYTNKIRIVNYNNYSVSGEIIAIRVA